MYRLSQSSHKDKFILKEALLFTAWQIPERRTTLDIDFLARYNNTVTSIETVIKDICHVAVASDGLSFDSRKVKGRIIKEDAVYEGVRLKFQGYLENARIPMQVDVAFGDIVYPKPTTIHYPVILDFPKPILKSYPMESVLSEKFEAMVKLGLLNSRMKDFYDVWLMIRKFDFNLPSLAEAIKKTFKHRKTDLPKANQLFDQEFYDENSDRQTLWMSFLKKGDIKDAPAKLQTTAREIEAFLIEALNVINHE